MIGSPTIRPISIEQKKWYFKKLYAASCFMTIHITKYTSLVQLIYILTRKRCVKYPRISIVSKKWTRYVQITFKWAKDGVTSESGDCGIDIARPLDSCSQSCGLVLNKCISFRCEIPLDTPITDIHTITASQMIILKQEVYMMENTTLTQHRNTDVNPTRYNPAQLHWICIGFALCDVAI